MIKNSVAFLRTAERERARRLRRLTERQREQLARDLAGAMAASGAVRTRTDHPRALCYSFPTLAA